MVIFFIEVLHFAGPPEPGGHGGAGPPDWKSVKSALFKKYSVCYFHSQIICI